MALALNPTSPSNPHDHLIAALAKPSNANGIPMAPMSEMSEMSEIPPPPISERRIRVIHKNGRDDAILVQACLDGDKTAFPKIWKKYVGLVQSKLGHVQRDIDDCVQEVFVRLHTRLPYLRDPTALSSFIIGIALRVAGTELRRRKSASWILLTPTGDLPEPARTEDTSAEAYARFQNILAKLGPRARRIFELRFTEHLELVDVAKRLGVSLATAKRYLARVSVCVNVMAKADPLLVAYIKKEDDNTATEEEAPSCACLECAVSE